MQTAVRARVEKRRIDIMLDVPIVEHFKALAGERGYQMINDTLRRILHRHVIAIRGIAHAMLSHVRQHATPARCCAIHPQLATNFLQVTI